MDNKSNKDITKMKELSLDNWILEGHGYTADSYRNKDDEKLLLKLFFTGDGRELAEREYYRALDVAALGIPTPKVYELVSVEGNTGIVFERILNKRSFGRLCTDNPERLQEYARTFAEQSKLLHSTKCNKDKFPEQKGIMRNLLGREDIEIREEVREFLNELLDRTDNADTCLHGDLQTGNMVLGEGDKAYFIDLGHFAYGNPVFDIAELYMCARVYQNEESNLTMLHFTTEQLEDFWKYYAIAYIGTDDTNKLKEFEDYVAPYAMFFLVLIISVSDGYESAINTALKHIEELYERYR